MKLIRWDTARDGPVSEAVLRARLAALIRGTLWRAANVSEAALCARLAASDCAVERHKYPAGTRIPSHSHDVEHFKAVVSGRLHMVMEGEALTLDPGDRLIISRDELHSTTVVGSKPAVVLEGFCE